MRLAAGEWETMNIRFVMLVNKLVILFYSRGDVQVEREREERRMAEISQNLERYKREIGKSFLCGFYQLSMVFSDSISGVR